MNKTYLTSALIAIVAVVGLLKFLSNQENGPGELDTFASCLKDKGAVFYGAFWCPHCQAQKKMFGSSAKLLPYQECSTPDANGQLKECTDAGIETYPTWIFADGEKMSGEIPLATLAEKTSCVLPEETK